MRGNARSERHGATARPGGRVDTRHALPPNQRGSSKWPVVHYGPLPRRADPETWQVQVTGATECGQDQVFALSELRRLPYVTLRADLHCVNAYSVLDLCWGGWQAAGLLDLAPPRSDVTHVMVYAEYGYSANLPLSDLRSPWALLATHIDGGALPVERGGPLRLIVPNRYAFKGPKWVRAIEYLTEDRRGFWEERGYHNLADPWQEQRYSYQEEPGDGPEL